MEQEINWMRNIEVKTTTPACRQAGIYCHPFFAEATKGRQISTDGKFQDTRQQDTNKKQPISPTARRGGLVRVYTT